MLSRVAESIYWLSRQVERAENLARFLEVTHNLTLDQPQDLVNPWEPLIRVTADDEYFFSHYGEPDSKSVTQFLAFDSDYPNSMLASLRQARENARSVRESLSSECYEQINEFYHFVNETAVQRTIESPNHFFDAVRRIALQWTGVLDSTMAHDLGWQFANIGRLIERADKTSRILDVKYFNLLPRVDDVGTSFDDLQWSALLLAISGFESYRRLHHSISIEKVVEFFIFNQTFPRSIFYCVKGLQQSLCDSGCFSQSSGRNKAEQRVVTLMQRLVDTHVKEVLAGGMHQFVDTLQIELNQIGESMNQDFFSHPAYS